MSESEPRFPGDPLTRDERAALIQENLQQPQTNHHPSCVCSECKPPQGGNPA